MAGTAPAREQQRLAAETTARQEATRRADEQRRREAVRWECQLSCDRHAVTLRELFPRERFEHHLTQWLGDNRPADLVEQHAEKLRELMQELVAQSAGSRANRLSHWIALNSTRMIIEAALARESEVRLGGWFSEWQTINADAAAADHFVLHTQLSETPPLSCSPEAAFLLEYRGHRKVYYVEQDRGTSSPQQLAAGNVFVRTHHAKSSRHPGPLIQRPVCIFRVLPPHSHDHA